MEIFYAIILATLTGVNVYRSCTRYQRIRRVALSIDILTSIAFIAFGHFGAGIW
jgi:hypothetical protein